MFLGLLVSCDKEKKIKGNDKFTMTHGLRNLVGLIAEASESAKD